MRLWGNHQVEQLAPDSKTMPFEHVEGELEIVTDLFDAFQFPDGAELFQDALCFRSLLGEGT